MKVDPRQMSKTYQRKDHHLFNLIAYMNRIGGENLDNSGPKVKASEFPLNMFVPTNEDVEAFKDTCSILIAHVWADFIPAFNWMKYVLPEYITHEHISQVKEKTERVHLGLLHKSENKLDEMQDIVGHIHQYVPGNDRESLTKITSGGDYLTFERHKRAQELHHDGRTPSKRLEGLIPNMELFHFQAEWNVVIWKLLFRTNSQKDIGTLYAARNSIDARNVTKDPGSNFYAAEELLNKYTTGYLVAGALAFFDMASIEDEPKINKIDPNSLDKSKVLENLYGTVRSFIDTFTDFKTPDIEDISPSTLLLKCRFCDKVYRKGPKVLRRHEKVCHHYQVAAAHTANNLGCSEDMILNYTKCAMNILLLRLNMNDAIKMGDGGRIYRNIEVMYLYFKATGCYKYAHGCLETLAQVKCLLSPRLAHTLMWNRTVNTEGKVNTNYPKDLDVEHSNKLIKQDLKTYRGEITEKTSTRISRSTDTTSKIAKRMDKITGVRKPSGKHTKRDVKDDVGLLVEQFHKARLFSNIHGRKHSAFPDVCSNPIKMLDPHTLKDWIFNTFRDVSERHFYGFS